MRAHGYVRVRETVGCVGFAATGVQGGGAFGGSFDTLAKRRRCCRSRRVCAGTFAVLLCPPDTVPGDDSSEKEATQLSHVRGCRTVFCNVSLGGSCCSVRRCREGEQLREQAVKEVLTAATKPKLRRNTLHNPSAGNHRDDYEERSLRRG